jgi:hypothetical protein
MWDRDKRLEVEKGARLKALRLAWFNDIKEEYSF